MDKQLQDLNRRIALCTKCPLRENASQPVCGIGEVNAKYLLIGEAPGREEDKYSAPFIGSAGKRLNKLLELAGIDQNECYLTNTVRCRPPGNRDPRKAELKACTPYLWEEIQLIAPEYVITLGRTPLTLFTTYGIRQLHGTLGKHNVEGREIPFIYQYHPAAALHQPRLWAVMLDDWEHLPSKTEASYVVVQDASERPDTVALDTENEEDGTLGVWSIAYRGTESGTLQVESYFRKPPTSYRHPNTVIFHNAKWDLRVLKRNGMEEPNEVLDTMIAAYCLGLGRQDVRDSAKGKSGDQMVGGLGLKYLARRHLGMDMTEWKEVFGKPELIQEYNANDSIATYLLFEKWKSELPNHFWTIDTPLLRVLMAMEDRGISVDPDFLRKFAQSLDERLAKFDLPLNAHAPEQIQSYVYGTLGIEPWRFTDNGAPSVDSDVLETIDDPVVNQILDYKSLYKEKGTYTDSYLKKVGSDGRLHTEFKQTSTVTGRLSSANPNLQNVIKGGDMRKLFIAPYGKKLIRVDWKLLEFGLLAALTQDPTLIEAFTGTDFHQVTADALGVDRDTGKHINFQIQNGGSPWGMSREYSIPIDLAKSYFKRYYERFPAVKRFHEETVEEAKSTKKVIGYYGRTRRLDALFAEDWRVRQAGEREAMTMPMQNGAAEIVKLAMIDLHYKHSAPLLLQVHDELIFEVDDRDAKEYAHWLKEYLPTLNDINGIQFPVSVGIGRNWWECALKE